MHVSIERALVGVAQCYDCSRNDLISVIRGHQKENWPRQVAMYLCQELAGMKLVDIAELFQFRHIGSVSFVTHQIRKKIVKDAKFEKQVNRLITKIIKQ